MACTVYKKNRRVAFRGSFEAATAYMKSVSNSPRYTMVCDELEEAPPSISEVDDVIIFSEDD